MNTSDNRPDSRPDSSNDTWESEMGDEFERRVRDLHEAPLDLAAVKGTARRIRTKRRAAVAGSLLAAAAVVVPVAVLSGNGLGDRADTVDPAGTPSVTVTDPSPPEPTPTQSQATLGFDYLETGADSTVLWLGNGETLDLPGPDYRDAADLGDQVAALRTDEEGNSFVDLVEDGEVSTTYAVRSAMATAPDGLTVAFITTDNVLMFVNDTQGAEFGPIAPGVTLSAIVGDGDCASESGCHPFLEYQDFTRGEAYEINYEGPDTAPAPGALRVNDADDDFLVSVITSVSDTETCGGLYDREGAGAWIFETCDYQVHAISPTGEYTIAFDSYFDGLGPRSFYLLDDEGNELAALTTTDGVIGDVTWADSTHAAATVYEDGAWKMISLGVDGAEEVLLEGAPGDEFSSPYRITGQS